MSDGKKRAATGFSRVGGCPTLDLLNTRVMSQSGVVDRLGSYADLVDWAVTVDLVHKAERQALRVASGTAAAVAALSEIRAMRESLRRTLESVRHGGTVGAGFVRLLNLALQRQPGRLTLMARDGKLQLQVHIAVATPAALVTIIAREVASFLEGNDLPRIRRCEGADCILWFVDRTRNNSRHWCRMDRCGARAKSANYYWRRKAKVAAPPCPG